MSKVKVLSVTLTNIRKIERYEAVPDGASFLLLGGNSRGKSTVINAIKLALGGDIDDTDLLQHGKEKGEIDLITSIDGREYRHIVKLDRKKDRNILTVESPDGISTKTKSVIVGLCGGTDFDIYEFARLSETTAGAKKQIQIFKSFLPQEVQDTLNGHEGKIAELYESRTVINRDIKQLEGFLSKFNINPAAKVVHIDTTEISLRLTEAIKVSENRIKAIAKRTTLLNAIDEKLALIEKLKEEVISDTDGIAKIDEWLTLNPQSDKDALMQELEDANKNNQTFKELEQFKTETKRLTDLKAESEDITIQIEGYREAVAETIRSMDAPVEGLSYNDDCLIYNDIPVSSGTLSTSEQMMLGFRLFMSKDNNSGVLLVQRGESLDNEKFELLKSLAKQYDLQLIMEQVSREAQNLITEIIAL